MRAAVSPALRVSVAMALVAACRDASKLEPPSARPPSTSAVSSRAASSSDGAANDAAPSAADAPRRAPLSKEEMAARMANLRPGEEREIDDGVFLKLLRLQATDPLGGGWQRAVSSEGGFSVEVPLPFNEIRTRAIAKTDGVEIRSHTVGGKTPGLLAYSATCVARRDGKLGEDGHAPGPEKTESKGTPVAAWVRSIELDDRTCVLVVEQQGSDPLPSEADRRRFLGSFKKTGKLVW